MWHNVMSCSGREKKRERQNHSPGEEQSQVLVHVQKAVFQKRTWESWWTGQPSWTWASNEPLWQRRQVMSKTILDKELPAGWRRWACPSLQHWWSHTWGAGSSLSFSLTRETGTYQRLFSEGLAGSWNNWSISLMRKPERAGTIQPGDVKSQEVSHKYLKGRAKWVEPGPFQWCPATGQEAMDTHWNLRDSLWD